MPPRILDMLKEAGADKVKQQAESASDPPHLLAFFLQIQDSFPFWPLSYFKINQLKIIPNSALSFIHRVWLLGPECP